MESFRSGPFDKPVDEVFTGSNGVRYRHVNYVVEYTKHDECGDENCSNDEKMKCFKTNEIKAVRWFTFIEAMAKLKRCNVERRELLKRVHAWCESR
jgi:hypothetical protein